MSLLVDREGNLWVGTRSSGLSFLEKGKQDFVQFLHDPDDANSLGANGVTDILEDSKNNIWVGTYTAGLNRLDPSTGKIDRFRNSVHSSMSLSDNRIMALFEDSDEVLWIGTHGGGLNRFTSSSNFQRFQHNSRNPDSISGNNIYAINEDESGNLWIGTQNSGLNRWGLEDRRNTVNNFERNARNFIDTTVNGLVIDTKGSVWVSSNKGLTQVDINTSRLKRYDTSHGLDAEFNHSAVLAASNGELYFGGMNGFNVFDPSTIGKNTHPPKVVITSVAKFNQQVNNLHTVLTDGLDLNYKDYLIEFRFAGLDYTSPEKTRYKYKLTGLEDTWVEAGDRRYASYTNLAPGNYTFQVIAANNDGAWSHEAATIDIQMTPAPWLTWYAYLAYLGICIFIGWALTGTHREKIRHADHVLEINKMLAIEINAGRAKESALEREKERAQSYLEITDILMVVIDRDGLIKLINQKGCEVLRLTEFQIIGTRLLRYVHQESQDDMQRWLKPGISDDTEAHYECALVSTNGHVHRIMWRFASFPDESGDGELLLASGMDVTDKRELEKAVRVQEKLSAVGTMASGIAHDFNNILTAINGYSVLAIEELSNKQEASKEYLDRVIEAGKRATDLVSRLLSFTHHEEQNLQPSDLGPPLLEAAALLRASLPATIEMSVDISCDLKPVKADTTQIHQLLMNLGTNAGKAMQGHVGVLQIIADTTYLRAPKENLRSAMQAGEYLRLLVQDNGIGMNGDVMCTIFDPFFTAKGLGFGDREGTGLGLSVVHRIVAAHNGHIDVKSQPGKGTTFTVLLPCCREKIDYRDTTGELSQHRFGRIMIVDDEEWVGDVCDKLLQLLGYSSTRFENADQALEELKGNPDKFDLVISDQNMPHMLGTEFVVEIRNINPVIPIILMSGNLSPLYTNDPLINYMKKPFTIEELGGLVKESLLTNVEPQTG
jgi:PAS domain S-box-containing protein